MAIRVMSKVWDAPLPPNHCLVLLAYADAAEADGTKSFPGEDRMASMTGYSKSQIGRVTRELIDAGLLVQVRPGYRGQRAEYHVRVDELDALIRTAPQSAALSESGKPRAHADLSTVESHASRRESHAYDTGKPRAHAAPSVLDPSRPTLSGEAQHLVTADDLVERWASLTRTPLTRTIRSRWMTAAVEFVAVAGDLDLLAFLDHAVDQGCTSPAGWPHFVAGFTRTRKIAGVDPETSRLARETAARIRAEAAGE